MRQAELRAAGLSRSSWVSPPDRSHGHRPRSARLALRWPCAGPALAQAAELLPAASLVNTGWLVLAAERQLGQTPDKSKPNP